MFRMYRDTRYQKHCGNGSTENSGPDRVFLVVSLSASIVFKRVDYGLNLDHRKRFVYLWKDWVSLLQRRPKSAVHRTGL